MANFRYVGTVGGVSPETKVFDVASGAAASIKAGDIFPVANGYGAAIANGGGVSTTPFYAYALNDSTDTAAAAGVVTGVFCPMGLILEGVATTPANLAAAVLFDKVTIDVSGAVITVDENDTSSGAMTIYKLIGTDYATTGKVQITLPWVV